MKRLILLLALVAPLCAFGDPYTKLVRTGETNTIPYKLSLNEVEAAILDGSVRRGWEPKKLSDGTIEDTLHIRSHIAVVHVVYTADSFRIDYADSTNLTSKQTQADKLSPFASSTSASQIGRMDEDKNVERIHKNYYVWTQNLVKYIQQSLESAKKTAETSAESVPNKLRELENLRKEGIISNDEYQKKRQQLLEKL